MSKKRAYRNTEDDLKLPIMQRMIRKYATYDYDWMGYEITKQNPLTIHHIISRKLPPDYKKMTIRNGAPLTSSAHQKLNYLQSIKSELFEEWQQLFRDIVVWGKPLKEEHYIKQTRLHMMTEELIELLRDENHKFASVGYKKEKDMIETSQLEEEVIISDTPNYETHEVDYRYVNRPGGKYKR